MPSLFSRTVAAIKARLTWSQRGGSGPYGYEYWRGDLWGPGAIGPVSRYDAKAAAGDLRSNSVARACLAWLEHNFPEARWFVSAAEGDQDKEVKNHPLARLLRRPNPYYSGDRLLQESLADWWFSGNVYWIKQRVTGGQVKELWPVPAAQMKPYRAKGGREFISGYVRRIDGKDEPWAVADVVHLRYSRDPDNEMLGWSPLASALYEIGNLNNGAAYRGALLGNMGVPAYALQPEGEAVAEYLSEQDETYFQAIRDKFRGLFARHGVGGLFIPSFPGKLTPVGLSPADLDIRTMLEWDADMVCALFVLSSMVVNLPSGANHRTYANMGEATIGAYNGNVKPTRRQWAEEFEIQLLPDFTQTPDTLNIESDYSSIEAFREQEEKRREQLRKMKDSAILTADEVRAEMGYDKLTPEQKAELSPVSALARQDDSAPEPESSGDQMARAQESLRGAEERRRAGRVNGRERELAVAGRNGVGR